MSTHLINICDTELPPDNASNYPHLMPLTLYSLNQGADPNCILCHGTGEHEMFSAHLPGQPKPEKRMVKCNQCFKRK